MSRFGSLNDPPVTFLLGGVRVVDPSEGTDSVRDLAVLDGRIVESAELPPDAPRLEGAGLVAAPGLCDLHTHLREPGMERLAMRAASRGRMETSTPPTPPVS